MHAGVKLKADPEKKEKKGGGSEIKRARREAADVRQTAVILKQRGSRFDM